MAKSALNLPAFLDRRGGALTDFDPQKAKSKDAQADAVIDYAQRIRDWPTLETAIEKKLEDQAEFVRWWGEKVSTRQSPGRAGNKSVAAQGLISVDQANDLTGFTKQQISKWRRRLQEPDKYKAMLFGAAYHKAMAEANNVTASKWTGDPESYTPSKYIEAARKVLGSIDLDPASNAHAQEVVKATEWYDEEENGLLQKWRGNVFLNPPYSYPLIGKFIDKLIDEFQDENVNAAILLTNNNTDTRWWHHAALFSSAICFTIGRINFYKADGQITQPTNGQNFFYFGPDVGAFQHIFTQFGMLVSCHEHFKDPIAFPIPEPGSLPEPYEP